MKGTWFLLCLCLTIVCADGRRRRKHDDESEDFEFADDSQTELDFDRQQTFWDKSSSSSSVPPAPILATSRPTESPSSFPMSYCSMVRCPSGTRCVLKDNSAICVPKKSNERSDSLEDTEEEEEEDEEEELVEEQEAMEVENYKGMVGCTPCPLAKPSFVCGADNKTYSSSCRLNYHNCIQNTNVQMACIGFCPCNVVPKGKHDQKLTQATHRWNKFMSKYKATASKIAQKNEGTPGGPQIGADSEKSGKPWPKSKSTVILNSAEDKQKQQGHNSALAAKIPTDGFKNNKDCPPKDLEVMGNRLLDWFSVVMADAKRNKSRRRSYGLSPATFPGYCKQEVKWMFYHLDQNSDAYLSLKELYDLEHESLEHCLKPFLERCDANNDMRVGAQEWCKCFDRSERPCTAAIISINRSRPDTLGAFYPECDEEGYYRRTQCHSSTGFCWCVDKHGVEYANTRIHGKPECDVIVGNKADGDGKTEFGDEEGDSDGIDDEDDDDDDDDEEEELEGSADRPLDI